MKRSAVVPLRDVISVAPSFPDVHCTICHTPVGRGAPSKPYICDACHEAITNPFSVDGKAIRDALASSRSNKAKAA